MASFMRAARQKFIVGFQATFETFGLLLAQCVSDPSAAPELHRRVHRVLGVAQVHAGELGRHRTFDHVEVEVKVDAGQSAAELANDLENGARLLEQVAIDEQFWCAAARWNAKDALRCGLDCT